MLETQDTETVRMKIGGMSCSFCVNTIKKAYMRIDGVEEVGVSLAHEEGLVRFDPTRVTADELVQTLRKIGFIPRDPDKVRTYEEDEAELRTARRHLYGAASLAIASVLIMALGKWFDLVTIPAMSWILFAFALITMFGFGWYIKKQAFSTLRIGILNQHNLLEFGAFGGLIGGILGLLGNSAFPAGEFFAVSTFITTYHILSGYVSLRLRVRSSQAVRRLLDLAPDTARVIRDGEEFEIPLEEVVVGDQVRIRPGESVPVDGVISEGASAIDEALVTGESIPTEKTIGDEVIGGSINQYGVLVVTVSRVGDESFLAQVANSIEEARALRPGALQLVDVVLKYYVPAVLGFAGFAFLAWMVGPLVVGGSPDPTRAVSATLAVLVMGYPCALGMATPLAMIRGGGIAAERGILMRSGEAFQVMQELDTVVFDKTGTITRGETVVTVLRTVQGGDADEMLRLAASVEAASEHPLARAIEQEAGIRRLELGEPEDFAAEPGRGVRGTVDGQFVLVAKLPYLVDQAIDVGSVRTDSAESLVNIVERLERDGQTVVGVAANTTLLGVIGISDTIKSDAADTVRQLADSGVRSVMITGDNERTARAVAAEVGIDTVIAGVLPSEKADHVRKLQSAGRRVAMVGDGINDAPALTQANIGIAIGAGTDIAIEAADIVLMNDQLHAVVDAYDIGRSSYRKTKQNLALAFAFNGIGVPLAVTGLLSPVWAMAAMVASVSTVLLNSFAGRLLRRTASVTRVQSQKAAAGDSQPASVTTTIDVDGMSCVQCENNINQNLARLGGVDSVNADHEAKTVTVEHNPGEINEDEISGVISGLGFQPVQR